MKRRMEQRRLLSNRIFAIICLLTSDRTIEYRSPFPVPRRRHWRLHLMVSRGEFAERNQRASTGCVIEWHGAVEI